MAQTKVIVLYGGKSTEHEVSVHSAQTVCRLLASQPDKYQIYPVFISKQGYWFLQKECSEQTPDDIPVTPVLRPDGVLQALDGSFTIAADVVFPVVHGTNCEDGTLQGFLETLNIPYVGCGVLTSALGMDKELTKLLASEVGIAVVPYQKVSRGVAYDKEALTQWVRERLPVFVKPVRLGSSVGVTRVTQIEQLEAALEAALQFDTDALIEQGVDHAREIFCAVYGDATSIRTSACGELRTVAGEFFDYNAKYIVAGGCETQVPAYIPAHTANAMRRDTESLFRALQGCGLARVDFLMDKNGQYYMSEINTLPGMSETSLFPQLFEASGENYAEILDRLIQLAKEVHARKSVLTTSR
ncbi:MAG: D-alanine--D-alanine ligase [Elusimicrobiaceae bacterium]|nr:D-alanine--D-alanine ligase [Elusimicrobiaceae bacterium]